MIIRDRLREHIPILICKTCGKIARQNKVIELEDPALIKDARYAKRKTWARLIKPSFNVHYDGARKLRNKRIFYAAILQYCIKRKHKIKVRYLTPIKFHKSYPDTIKEFKKSSERKLFVRKKKKLVKGESVNCASCNKRVSIFEVCMNCARCPECCACKAKRKIKHDDEKRRI